MVLSRSQVSIWLHMTGATKLSNLYSLTKTGGMSTAGEQDNKRWWAYAWMLCCPKSMRGWAAGGVLHGAVVTNSPRRPVSLARVRPGSLPPTPTTQPLDVIRRSARETPGLDRVGVQARLIVRTAHFLAAMSAMCVLAAVLFNVGDLVS